MTTRAIQLLGLALLAVACGGEPEVPEDPPMSPIRVLPNLAIPPGGEALGSEGGSEAASVLVSTPMSSDSVVQFYRDLLSRPPYRLINEAVDAGRTSFYVEQDGPPLWVTVEALEAGGTLVRLTGAAVKTSGDSATGAATTP